MCPPSRRSVIVGVSSSVPSNERGVVALKRRVRPGTSYAARARRDPLATAAISRSGATIWAFAKAAAPCWSTSPPAWSRCRWLGTMLAIRSISIPALTNASRAERESVSASLTCVPAGTAPVSRSTAPLASLTCKMLSACKRRDRASSSLATIGAQVSWGTGPKIAPASLQKVPIRSRSTVIPPRSMLRRSVTRLGDPRSVMRLLLVIKANVRCRCRWFCLALITAAQFAAAVRTLNL